MAFDPEDTILFLSRFLNLVLLPFTEVDSCAKMLS